MAVTSWTETAIAIILLQLGWLIYGVIYRLFLSPLAKIPGPKLAALTSWYEFYYDVIKPGKYVWKIKDLHTEYGVHHDPTCVRSGSNLCRTHHTGHALGGSCQRH